VWCAGYSACLDHAIENQWPGWTCIQCSRRVSRDADIEDVGEEAQRALKLWTRVFEKKAVAAF